MTAVVSTCTRNERIQMKSYPSINGGVRHGVPVYVFDKLDGSNLRAEWTRKRGWVKYGRRNGLLDDTFPLLRNRGQALMEAQGPALAKVFKAQRWEKATAYFEFHGPGSFAGNHDETEDHQVSLIDVAVHRKGLLLPRDFVKLFDGVVPMASLLHVGNFTHDIKAQVEAGTFPGMTFEGVVAKGAYVSPGRPLMFKRKNQAWLDRLRAHCGDDDEMFRRLA